MATQIKKGQLSADITTLGYASVTGGQSGITTITDLTSLSVTVTVPSGARIKITGFLPQIYSTSDTDRADFHIREGSTSLGVVYGKAGTSSHGWGGPQAVAILQPTAGSHTYKLSLARGAGTGSIVFYAGSETPAFILVELI